jgi:pimeloyl-ACP methyl ester carboxylesterase
VADDILAIGGRKVGFADYGPGDGIPVVWCHGGPGSRLEPAPLGFEGYADDRIADKPGWVDFDVSTISCPVIVLHGSEDILCDPKQARHTAKLVPGAELCIVDGLGHFSIVKQTVPALVDLLAPTSGAPLGGA